MESINERERERGRYRSRSCFRLIVSASEGCGSLMETASATIFGASFGLPAASRASLRWGRIGFVGYRRKWATAASSLEKGGAATGGGSNGKKVGVPNSNYVVPLDMAAAGLTRPLNEILRDLNKRVPDKIINLEGNSIPWYHANRMLSFYAPGWCGEVRDVIFSDDGSVAVVYRVTIRGSDGEAHRESTGTASSNDSRYEDPVTAAEEIAFCRACARFGFGLHLYHEDEAV